MKQKDELRLVEIKVNGVSIGRGYEWDGEIVFDKRILAADRASLLQVLVNKLTGEKFVSLSPTTLDSKLQELDSPCIVATKFHAEKHIRILPYDGAFLQHGGWQPESDVSSKFPECEFVFETTIK